MGSFLRILIYVSLFFGFFAFSFYIFTFLSSIRRKIPLLEDSELPFVSIIIPAWNEEKSVERTLNSILNSDYPNFEVIFIDDGSTDNTLKIARRFEKNKVRVYTKTNGGKASALNFGISKSNGEIIFTMDADTKVEKESMKKMVRYFKDKKVVSVTPAMLIDVSDNFLRKIQKMEYLFGVFLRKVFATLNAIYIAPGAFTCYRKSFFEKYGGYDKGNITEDLEMSLRIQSKGYKTENCPDALVYTSGPATFKALTKQRVRWYYGLIKNSLRYKHMFGRKFGDLGLVVLPVAWITIFFSIIITIATLFNSIKDFINEAIFLSKIHLDIFNLFNFSIYELQKFLISFFSEPLVIFAFFSIIFTFLYLKYATYKTGKIRHLLWNSFIFLLFFGPLFCYWWVVSFFKFFIKKDVKWR